MSSTYTTRLQLEEQGTGENATTWGTILNTQITCLDQAIAGVVSIDAHGDSTVTLSTGEGVTNEARQFTLYIHGSVSTTVSVLARDVEKGYFIHNNVDQDFPVKLRPISRSASAANLIVPQGVRTMAYTDGSGQFFDVATSIAAVKIQTTDVSAVTGTIDTIDGVTGSWSACVSATNMVGATGNFTTKVSSAAITLTGVVSAASAVFSGNVSAAEYYGDGSNLTGIITTPQNYLTGMQLSNATDAEHDISISEGTCRDNNNDNNITLSSAMVKRIDSSWVAGSGNGGLASSLTLAVDTWYHVFVILVGDTADAGFDTSTTAANLVADHSATDYRRVGSVRTDGSKNILNFKQWGDEFRYNYGAITTTGYTRTDLENMTYQAINIVTVSDLPLGFATEGIFQITSYNFTNNEPYMVWPYDVTVGTIDNDFQPAAGAGPAGSFGYGNSSGQAQGMVNTLRVRIDESQRVKVMSVSNNSTGDVVMYTMGWYDTRGKDG